MPLKTVDEIDVKDKKVLVRVDFDLPTPKSNNIVDYSKIDAVLPTIEYLLDQNAKVILISHLSKSSKKNGNSFTMEDVAVYICKKLGCEISIPEECLGDATKKLTSEMLPSTIVMLENLISYEEELSSSISFSKKLADLADIYVNEAFEVSHLELASTGPIVDFFDKDSICVGINFKKEYEKLKLFTESLSSPFVVILSGDDVFEEVELVNNLIDKIDVVIVSGKVLNTILKATGRSINSNYYDKNSIYVTKKLLQSIHTRNIRLVFPTDFYVENKAKTEIVETDSYNEKVVDIGPQSANEISDIVSKAKSLIWVGPLFSNEKFSGGGTKKILDALKNNKTLFSLVLEQNPNNNYRYADSFDSSIKTVPYTTSLVYLQGKVLPPIDALERKYL